MGWVCVADASRHWLVLLVVVTATTVAAACGTAEAPRVIELGGPTMGTTWSVKLVPGPRRLDAREVERLDGQIRDVLGRIDALMSTWNPDSELS